ncbi:MAG: PilZ domain-containing protein [Pseudomonadales bacterium]
MSDNIIEIATVRARPRQRNHDKRMHPRIESSDRLFTQVVLSADAPDLVGRTLACTAVNMSVGGIQFRTNSAVPIGALLDLWVDIPSRQGKFFLAGEVRWTRPGDPGVDGTPVWYVGVQLQSGAATDLANWRDFHAGLDSTTR